MEKNFTHSSFPSMEKKEVQVDPIASLEVLISIMQTYLERI